MVTIGFGLSMYFSSASSKEEFCNLTQILTAEKYDTPVSTNCKNFSKNILKFEIAEK